MDRDRVKQWESQCIQEQAPACSAACPIHVDARKLVECVRKEDFKTGLKVFTNSILLPQIIARICDHPCHQSCKRSEAGDSLNISALERACVEFGGPVPQLRRLAAKHKRVAVVGGGMSGVVAALDLAAKGYEVSIFEARSQLLSRLRTLGEERLPQRCIEQDLELLKPCEVSVQCDTRISSSGQGRSLNSLIDEFDAVYLGCGEGYAELNSESGPRLEIDPVTYATRHPKVFAGGTLRYAPANYSPIVSLQDGRYAGLSIDRFLQGASLSASRELQGSQPSRLFTDTSNFPPASQVVVLSSPSGGYTREEAAQEAERCFPCSCMECVKVCEYLKEYGSYPKRYVREIYNNLCIVMGVRNKNRMINSCSLCGLCTAVCPEKVNMGEVCLDARQSLVAAKKMPVSAHEFALRDMAFSTGEAFAMARHQPGHTTSAALFFPGCQLAASSPEHVQSCYEFLCETYKGGVGLMLNCCGAPALWAGRNDIFEASMRALETVWREMGEPRIITACSSCYRTLKGLMPQMKIESLWPHLNHDNLPRLNAAAQQEYAIHDPCATRGVGEVEDGARQLLQQLGVQPKELNERGLTTCCGYGGLTRFANPDLADKTVARRAQQNTADYVTYCAMCRDSFARQGKRALHVLDLVFDTVGSDPASRPDPGFSMRQENRAHLKTRLLRELWGEEGASMEPAIKLLIPEDVKALMEQRMILVEDVRRAIEHAEQSGEKIKHPGNGHWLACHRPSCVTYWVEYTTIEGAFQVFNAYFHRMQVS